MKRALLSAITTTGVMVAKIAVATAAAAAATGSPGSLNFPTAHELVGRNLVLCVLGADTGFWFDGPSFRAEELTDRHCRAYTVGPGQYSIGYQHAHPVWNCSYHHTSVTRAPGQTAAEREETVLTTVAAPPAEPSLVNVDGSGTATGPGVNVTLVVFHFTS